MKYKRLVATALSVLMLGGTPAYLSGGTKDFPATIYVSAAGNVTICGVDIGIAAGTYMQFTDKYGTPNDSKYYYNGYCLAASQCFGFARWCQYKMFGYHSGSTPSKFYHVSGDGISHVSAGGLNESKLKAMILASKPGAHIRTNANASGTAHSLIITDITDSGFSIAQCNGSNNNEYTGWKHNYVGTYTYTWSSYVASTYGQRGIDYIELPKEYAFEVVPPVPSNQFPTGAYSATAGDDGTVIIEGWGFDPDEPDKSLTARVYFYDEAGDTFCIGDVPADQPREDVNQAYGITGNHGILSTMSVGALAEGRYQVRIALLDSQGGDAGWLDSDIYVNVQHKKSSKPVLTVDVARGEQGTIQIAGWAYDPDDPGASLPIHVYIDDNEWVGGTGCVYDDEEALRNVIGDASAYKHRFAESFLTNLRGEHTLKIAALDSDGGEATWAEIPITITEPVNLGDEFDAQIINTGSGKYVYSAGTEANVILNSLDTATATVAKVTWHFKRQDDGSYRIMSYYNERYIDAYGVEDANGVNIWTYEYDPNSPASKWFIIKNGDGYSLRPSYSATRVMDVSGGSSEDRANIQLYENNGSSAQIFDIQKLDGDNEKPVIYDVKVSDVTPTGYTLTITAGDNVGLKRVQVPTWTEIDGQTGEAAQDDLIWHDAVQKDYNTWVCDIPVHNGEYGKYISDVYAFDFNENAEMYRTVIELSETLPGDVDGDKEVSVLDAVMLQKWILAKKGAKLTTADGADMNRDGVVDVFDLALLKRKLLQK